MVRTNKAFLSSLWEHRYWIYVVRSPRSHWYPWNTSLSVLSLIHNVLHNEIASILLKMLSVVRACTNGFVWMQKTVSLGRNDWCRWNRTDVKREEFRGKQRSIGRKRRSRTWSLWESLCATKVVIDHIGEDILEDWDDQIIPVLCTWVSGKRSIWNTKDWELSSKGLAKWFSKWRETCKNAKMETIIY